MDPRCRPSRNVNYIAMQFRLRRQEEKKTNKSNDLTALVEDVSLRTALKMSQMKPQHDIQKIIDDLDDLSEKMDATFIETERNITKKMNEQIDKVRTTTLVCMYDAVNDYDAKIEKIGKSTGGFDDEVLDHFDNDIGRFSITCSL